jgi:hypothetical protein
MVIMSMQESETFRTISLDRPRPLIEDLKPGDRIQLIKPDGDVSKRPIIIYDPRGELKYGRANAQVIRER